MVLVLVLVQCPAYAYTDDTEDMERHENMETESGEGGSWRKKKTIPTRAHGLFLVLVMALAPAWLAQAG